MKKGSKSFANKLRNKSSPKFGGGNSYRKGRGRAVANISAHDVFDIGSELLLIMINMRDSLRTRGKYQRIEEIF